MHRQGIGRRDADVPLDALRLAGGRQRHHIRGLAHGADVLEKLEPRLGEGQRPADPLEQGHLQAFL
jgi:hypothetical protein